MAASSSSETWKWVTTTFSVAMAFATISTSAAISVYFWRRKPGDVDDRVHQLQVSLKDSIKNCAAERRGRIRAQQALRKALAQPKSENLEFTSYPMSPIGVIQSCFSTRNGTPRQPVVVPLAKACLIFDPTRVPQASLEGLEEYSHCWIIYVFHLNTDLDKLWKHPSKSKFKAKVRVPRLEGGKKGVFATRSPHRPCPIGLTMAKVEAVQGRKILLSGVDLVDGTPVLDVKPYLPYCDNVQEATVPEWVKGENLLAIASVNFSKSFSTSLANCWTTVGKKSLYASPSEYQSLVKQVLSWDIRSVSQRRQPHNPVSGLEEEEEEDGAVYNTSSLDNKHEEEAVHENGLEEDSLHSDDVIYNLILEGLNISYRINSDGNVLVEKAAILSHTQEANSATSDDV